MIDLSDLQLTEEKTMFFMPAVLWHKFSLALEKQKNSFVVLQNIDYERISWSDINQSPDLKAKYEKYQQESKKTFDEAGFVTHHDLYDGIISNIEPGYLFEKLKLFYDDNSDCIITDVPDDWEPDWEPDWDQNEENQESVTIDVNPDEFEVFGSFEDTQKLSQLMQEKQLTEDDLRIILHTISIRDFY